MALLDAWSQRAVAHREEQVTFLGAPGGSLESTLKRELLLEFVTRPDIRRAYLASAAFQSESEPATALCIVSARPDDQSLVVRVGEIVRRLYAKDAVLNVLFLSVDQEAQLAQVCPPFYRSAI